MIPMYNTKTFKTIYDDADSFLEDYNASNYTKTVKEANIRILYELLYANFANSPIMNYDMNQFKAKLFGIIFQYGATWERKLDIQTRLRSMSEKELLSGSKNIINTSLNPDQAPTTEEVAYVNQQNVSKNIKSVLAGYNELLSLLKADVTQEFIDRFKKLFRKVVMPDEERIYIYEEE